MSALTPTITEPVAKVYSPEAQEPVIVPVIPSPSRTISLSFVPHYRAGSSTRRHQSLAKRMRKCRNCAKAPRGICALHSKETRRAA